MLLHKIESPDNFSFGPDRKAAVTPRLSPLGEGVFRMDAASRLWKSTWSKAVLEERCFRRPARSASAAGESERAQMSVAEDASVSLSFDGAVRLQSAPGRGLGLLGKKWIMVFEYSEDMRFYGLGEKYGQLEKTGVRTRFWNTDVFSDFPKAAVYQTRVDPLYVSIPYLLVVRPGFAVGILVNNPFAVYMDIAAVEGVAQEAEGRRNRRFTLGAPDGRPSVYFIVGETPVEVTRKLQRLCGTTPLPPLWALGHQQCRWGYESEEDLRAIAESFRRHNIPNDGLWLDIDYMDGYRVFTFDRKSFPDPAKQIHGLSAEEGEVVPILDPGVKVDPGYEVYDDGLSRRVFCTTMEGRPYVGFVWPGRTVFPDFSLPETRDWWAGYVKRFAETGVSGVWIDMNDPSTGSADYEQMRFGRGRLPHESYHNQYALGMQMATRDGFLRARPNERPFLISRSGYISTSRFSAVWTGDNASNYVNLAQSIQVSLNLSLSGVPFVGADVGGFGLDCTPELLVAWYKAAFLFPFFRNHSQKGTRRQEPWAMGTQARLIISHYIRLRYKLLPYIYSLFVAQAERGEPILRPLFLEFPGESRQDLSRIQDQFMVGPAVMQAPIVDEGAEDRRLVLPPGLWYDPAAGGWMKGERETHARGELRTTPLYFREGTIVPMLRGEPREARSDLSSVELHLFLSRRGASDPDTPAQIELQYDDGRSFDYRKPEGRSVLRAKAWTEADHGTLVLDLSGSETGYGDMEVEPIVYDSFRAVVLIQDGVRRELKMRPYSWNCCNSRIECVRGELLRVGPGSR